MNHVDPNLFYLDFGRVGEVLLTIVVFAMLLERALAMVFENRFFIEKVFYTVERSPGGALSEGKADSSITASIGSGNVVSVRSKNRSLKEIITLAVAFAVCVYWDFDAFSILMPVSHTTMTGFGMFLTAMIVAGGSKAAVKLFTDWMDIKSSAQREIDEFKKAAVHRTTDMNARALRSIALLLPAFAFLTTTEAQTGRVAIVSQVSYVRATPSSSAAHCYHAQAGDTLVLLSNDDFSSYYHVEARGGCTGYVYRNRVRLREADLPAWANGGGSNPVTPITPSGPRQLRACSFNIKFIGQGQDKQHQPLVDLMKDYDLVLVQELVSAPIDFTYGGQLLASTPQAREFFSLMAVEGFQYALSNEKTGPEKNRNKSSLSEYFVAFYKPGVLRYDPTRSGFINAPLVLHGTFDRVPWKFHFATTDATLDFAVTSVHLKQGATPAAAAGRSAEIDLIAQLVATDPERDQLIVGDMNIEDLDELQDVMPPGYSSLNAACVATNTSPTGPKPFDHVMYREQFTGDDIDRNFFHVLNLLTLMEPSWDPVDGPYPGDPYKYGPFGSYYSDHNPVEFRMRYGVRDDD